MQSTIQALTKQTVCLKIFEIGCEQGICSVFLSPNSDGMPEGVRFCTVLTKDKVSRTNAFSGSIDPMNLLSIVSFIKVLNLQFDDGVCDAIVYHPGTEPRDLRTAVFLLGACMLLMLDMTPDEVKHQFSGLDPASLAPPQDCPARDPDKDLTLISCWQGIHRAIIYGWLARPTPDSPFWGRIDIDEYALCDDPLNADLHVVVPGKLIAFRGPRDLGGAAYRDRGRERYFAPSFFLPILSWHGTAAVVQLGGPAYDPSAFAAAGVAHHRLVLDGGAAAAASSTLAAIARFFAVVDAAQGPIGVHCGAGQGLSGTLIALYLMRRHGFAAREAMGWLRVVRPRSVVGVERDALVLIRELLRRLEMRAGGAWPAGAVCASQGRGCGGGLRPRHNWGSCAGRTA
jgi:hypothetical protein